MRKLRFNLFSLGLVLLSACGNKTTRQDVRQSAPPSDQQLVGSLGDAYKELSTSRFQSDCDKRLNPIKKELVLASIAREQSLTNSPSTGSGTLNTISFDGSFLISEVKASPSPAGWSNSQLGWKKLNQYYVANKDNPPVKFWSNVNILTRSLMSDDQRRVVYGVNYSINHENVKSLPEILKTVSLCSADESCLLPPFRTEILPVVKSIEFYRYFLEAIQEAQSNSEKRNYIVRFAKRVTEDGRLRLSDFNPELSMKRENGVAHIELGIDATHFTPEEQTLFKKLIEDTWTSPVADIKLKIQSKTENTHLFELLFHKDSPGERAYVSLDDKTMNLFPGTSTLALAHEFGHVIGFSDHYFTAWDETKCEYANESNTLDVMSDHTTGSVTSEEWTELLDHLDAPQS